MYAIKPYSLAQHHLYLNRVSSRWFSLDLTILAVISYTNYMRFVVIRVMTFDLVYRCNMEQVGYS